jgi:tetratricopeptide (TPR) repeat protein
VTNEAFATEIIEADKLVTQKRFAEAKPILEKILAQSAGNARALFGLAQVVEHIPDPTEVDEQASDEDRASAQMERLERAVNLYRRAALSASPREQWLASWSHVYAGRILDFLELRDEAVAEYQAAVKVGDVPQGAFKEAKVGVERPYEP